MEDYKYSIAATETLYILKNTNEDDVRKMPTDFIDFLKSIANQNYEPKLDNSKTLEQMEIQEETKGILGAIYRNWWCSEEEKIYYNQLFKEEELKIQQEKRIKYNPNDIFKEKKQQGVKTEKRIEEINNSSNKMIEDKDNEYRTTPVNSGKYDLVMFAMAKLIEMDTTEQNKVALYLFNKSLKEE